MEREGKKTRILIGTLATALVVAILTSVGLGVQSAGRWRDLSASTTALQENTDTLQKAQDALVEAKGQADELRIQLETAKGDSQAALTEKETQLAEAQSGLTAAQKKADDLTAKLKEVQAQFADAQARLDEALATKTKLEQKGFEDQLIGAKTGDDVTVKVAFPADYGAAHLAGKDAEFACKVKSVSSPGELTIDDE